MKKQAVTSPRGNSSPFRPKQRRSRDESFRPSRSPLVRGGWVLSDFVANPRKMVYRQRAFFRSAPGEMP
jgi:hypothetical protein